MPIADLEEFDTMAEMEVAAAKYQIAELKRAAGKPASKANAEEEERETKSLDTAEGRIGGVKIPKPGTPEFEEFWTRVKQTANR